MAGSFRDPSGYVFLRQGRVFRAISEDFLQIWNRLCQNGQLARLITEAVLVPTRLVSEPLKETLAEEHPGFAHFLEHDRIDPISYPYEWSLSMLADAGLLTLDLQLALLGAGLSLKDASAYNIQFVQGRPVFIDVTSIEHPKHQDLWFALGQFQRMFLFPLLLCRHRGWDLRTYFIPNLDGLTPEQVRQSFPGLSSWRPSLLMDLTLPCLLDRWQSQKAPVPKREHPAPSGSSEAQVFNLKRLRRKIVKLAADFMPHSEWTNYTNTCSYDEAGETAKKKLVREFLNETRPQRVFDLGCNTGDYSFIAAECGSQVVAADGDPNVIEQLYRRLRAKPCPISPVVLNIANPSPAIGFCNQERARFLDRIDADCLLALALIHHLMVSANFSMDQISHLFADLTRRHAVVEYVPLNDPMFQRLLRFRVNLFENHCLETCRAAFLQHFEIIKEVPIPDSSRTLLFLRKK